MNKIFTKEYTLNAKGIAIIIMCMHHLFSTSAYLTPITKVCVAMFTILSGYGINESYKKQGKKYKEFVWIHIKRLMINYWYVFVPMTLLSVFWYVIPNALINVYGNGINGLVNFILDFLGIRAFVYTPSLNNTWWYMEAILCCYILFPIILKGIKKKTLLTFIILLIPNVLGIWYPEILITTDREIFYILPFALGIFFSEKGIFNKIVKFSLENKYRYIIISIPIMILNLLLATKIKLIGNIFYAVSTICVSIWLSAYAKNISKLLMLLGKHSMNIFLSHSFFYFYLIPGRKLMYICKIPIVKLIVLIIVSLIFSILIEKVKSIVSCLIKGNTNSKIDGRNKEKIKDKLII